MIPTHRSKHTTQSVFVPVTTRRLTQPEKRAATRARLLDAAGTAMARHGYRGASLEAVAERAGLSKGALTYHFATKAQLLLALAAAEIEKRRGRLRATTPDLDLSDPDAAARAIVTGLPYGREWSLLFLEFVCQGARDRQFRNGLTSALELGRVEAAESLESLGLASGAEARRLADALSAMSNGASIEALLDGNAERATALLTRLFSLVLRGLAAEAAERD